MKAFLLGIVASFLLSACAGPRIVNPICLFNCENIGDNAVVNTRDK